VDVVDIPDDGPMTFEFDIEVRPEFDVPQWKGLKLERPAHTFSDDEVGGHLSRLLDRYGTTQTVDDAAAAGLIVVADITVRHGDQIVAQFPAESLPVRRVLSFTDAKLEGFDKLVEGKKAGDVVTATVTVGKEAERESLRGQQVELEFAIQSVARRALPELTSAFLDKIGGFADEAELKMAVREELERQLSYQQQRAIRQQISALLTVAASWSLPPDLLRRQAKRELERSVLELRRSGFSDNEIRAHANELRQNTLGSTERALKEHFILERIAEEEKIDVDPTDYEREISMIAAQSDESERRVRARLEKRGMMDTLRNQIVERKVIDLICLHAEFKDGPYQAPKYDTTAVTHSLASVAEEIPEAKHAPEVQRPGMPSNSGKLPSSSGNKPS
jgi:trigger factor